MWVAEGDRRRSVKRAKAYTPGSVDGGETSLLIKVNMGNPDMRD